MKKIMILLAALLVAGCGKVDDLSHREGAESRTSATSPTSVTTAAAAGETSAETSAAETTSADSAQETSAKRSAKKKTTTTTTTATAAQKASDTAEAATTAIGSTPLADTDTVPETEPPRETFATPTVQPGTDPKTDNDQQHQDPDFHSDIFQPAHFVSQTFSANWENLEVMSGGSPAVIHSADELRAYLEPVFPEDFIRERLDFYSTKLLGGENFFDDNVLLVNTLPQGSGTEPMVRIDRCDLSESVMTIKYSRLYEDGCAYPEVMSVCLLQVTAGRDWLGSKSVEWSLSPNTQGE